MRKVPTQRERTLVHSMQNKTGRIIFEIRESTNDQEKKYFLNEGIECFHQELKQKDTQTHQSVVYIYNVLHSITCIAYCRVFDKLICCTIGPKSLILIWYSIHVVPYLGQMVKLIMTIIVTKSVNSWLKTYSQ